jgi:hypothetical protein
VEGGAADAVDAAAADAAAAVDAAEHGTGFLASPRPRSNRSARAGRLDGAEPGADLRG